MKSINCILLVDDDESDNFYHTLIIEEVGFSNQIKVVTDGRHAFEYMKKALDPMHSEEYPKPSIIFLDTNMPLMDGFDFLEEYIKLDQQLTSDILIVMLTTSFNSSHKEKAMKYNVVKDCINKPLTIEMLQEIKGKYLDG